MRSRIIAAAISLAGLVAIPTALAFGAPNASAAELSTSAAQRATGVSAPEISAPSLVQVSSDQSVSIVAHATDPDLADVLTITATGAPASLSLSAPPSVSPASGTLSGTLGAGDVGSHLIEWTVSSTEGGSATTTTTLHVAENGDPTISSPASVSGAATLALTFGVTATDPDGDLINSLTATGVPAGATFTANAVGLAGTFSWTPLTSQQGTYSVTFEVSSGTPARTASSTTIINIGAQDRFPVVTPSPSGTVTTVPSVLTTVNVTVSDPDGDAINLLECKGTQNTPLPVGATFTKNPANTSGQLLWTPTPAQIGNIGIDFIAESGVLNLRTVVVVRIRVNPDRVPVVTAPATVSGAENSPIAFTVTASDPDATPILSLTASPLPAGASFTPNGAKTSGAFAWTPGFTQAGTYSVVFTAANALSTSRTTVITVANVDGSLAPVVTAPASVSGIEGAPISFGVTASDPDEDAIASLTALGLPAGATFTAEAGNTSGTFDWTPGFAQSGSYPVLFRASNGLLGSATTNIAVANQNRAPHAVTGGPYSGVAGIPVAFNGSASSDPDGDALTYSWNFGDGASATGVAPTHTYAAGGGYTASLTVTDGGTPPMSNTATTSADITTVFAARVFTSGGGNKVIRLGSGKPQWCMQVEAVGSSFVPAAVSLPSVRLKHAGNEIQAIGGKTLFAGDTDNNGSEELTLCFSKTDLRTLLPGLPSGKTTVTLELVGALNSGGLFGGTLEIDVFGTGGTLAASVTPNPLNPEATLNFVTTKAGPVRVRLYDASGRFVRTLDDRSNAPAGYQDIRIDGRDQNGGRMATGVYFYRAETPDGAIGGRFTILK